jgi:hypothetical protein
MKLIYLLRALLVPAKVVLGMLAILVILAIRLLWPNADTRFTSFWEAA